MNVNLADMLVLMQMQKASSAWQNDATTEAGISGTGVSGTNDLLFSVLLQALLGGQDGTQGSSVQNLLSHGSEGQSFSAGKQVQGYSGSGRLANRQAYQPLDGLIAQMGQKYGINPGLIREVVRAESGFNSDAVSPVGAQGLMQLMPGTAASYGVNDTFDPVQNLDGGTHFLADLLNRFQGNVPLALAAYNAGPGAVEKYQGIPPYKETQAYVQTIMTGLTKVDEKA